MSLRWLTPGLALVVASLLSCDNQGKGVGTDVIEQLCELNREAVLALHSTEGMAAENGTEEAPKYAFTYCDYWVDSDGDGTPDKPQQQGSCKELGPTDLSTIVDECKRNGTRVVNRCWKEMEAMYACLRTELEQASSRLRFFTDNFNCWLDSNGSGAYNGWVYWTWPADGSRPEADLNHPETCNPCEFNGTCGTCGTDYTQCYLMKELPTKGDETIPNNNVVIVTTEYQDPKSRMIVDRSLVCRDEYIALNDCSKESAVFLNASANATNAANSAGVAGAAGAGTQ